MDAETYEQSRTPQPLQSQHLADMAKRIAYIAKRYGEIAAAIAEIPSGQLSMPLCSPRDYPRSPRCFSINAAKKIIAQK